MSKILGLDLGSSSIGWALRNDENKITSGIVTFDSGMLKGKSGYASPTKDRREARSKRRLIQARKYRKWAILEVLIKNNYTPLLDEELKQWSKYEKGKQKKYPETEIFKKWLACDFSYENGVYYENPYELRIRAINSIVSKHEFGRALYHLVQRRGYKNIGETDTDELNKDEANKDKETKKQLERREKEGFALALQNNRTIAEALKNDFLDKGLRARNQYPLRKEYRYELEQLCKMQGFDITRNEVGIYKDSFIQSLWKAIIWQRPLRSQKGNIGRCTLEKDKLRCPVSHPLFEIFRAWQFINTIKYSETDSMLKFLPQEIRNELFDGFFLKKDKNVKFAEIKKHLDKKFDHQYRYNYKDDHTTATMPICRGLIQIFGTRAQDQIKHLHKYNITNSPKIINDKYSIFDVWHALYSFDDAYVKHFATSDQKLNIPNEIKKNGKSFNPFIELRKLILSSFSDLSIKSITKIIPFLEIGFLYNEAVLLAKIPEILGGDWENHKEQIYNAVSHSNEKYKAEKGVIKIVNGLIDTWKGLQAYDKSSSKIDVNELTEDNLNDINNACLNSFGEQTWTKIPVFEREIMIDKVKTLYNEFLKDSTRAYRVVPTLGSILKAEFKKIGINIDLSMLYHHSKLESKYKAPIIDKKSGTEILSVPIIDSIRNPMFNKAMCILRKLLNELILNNAIDHDTDIIIEIARELNDNNKRIAIERYQREREKKIVSFAKVLREFKEQENAEINIDENLLKFELWTEQIFDKKNDDAGKSQYVSSLILKENDASKRYELWKEQKGICIYSGKPINFSHLFSNEVDIEHTIPRSLLPDNTMANQTVCFAWYNRDKKKKLLPTQCKNYTEEKEGWGSPINERLKDWAGLREHYHKLYEDKKRAKGSEDEVTKDKRIQDKHYYKMHLDYWTEKIDRFTCDEIKESWVRRQLTDTQMISRYAREFLTTYFNKVKVQKASVNSSFKKIFGFQDEYEIKNRNRHTHHAIDAAVLTLIPTNSSYRDKLLKTMYEWKEKNKGQYTIKPYENFNVSDLIENIENSVLAVNYHKDKIFKKTYKKVRNRGRILYIKNKKGDYITDSNDNKIIKIAKGDSIRSTLYKQTFLAKLRNVERDESGKPLRDQNGRWIFKKGNEEFFYAERVNIEDAKKYIDDIVDERIKQLVKAQKGNPFIRDHQENIIRHVRVKSNAGKTVKLRLNYLSKHIYKNNYYSAAGSLPYAAFLQNRNAEKVERIMIPISSAELGKFHKRHGKVDVKKFIIANFPEYSHYSNQNFLKIGQKVLVLKDENEVKLKLEKDFQIRRLYVIKQFSEGSIWLKYHLEAQDDTTIKDSIKVLKDSALSEYEKKLGLPEITEDHSIVDVKERKKDFEDKKFRFNSFNTDYRLKRLAESIGIEKAKKIKEILDQFTAYSGSIKIEGQTPLLKLSQENWKFLFEDIDFEMKLIGSIYFR